LVRFGIVIVEQVNKQRATSIKVRNNQIRRVHEHNETASSVMATMTALRNAAEGGPNTAERKLNAQQQLRRNLAITDSARERIRTKLIDTTIEDSPVKRDRGRTKGEDEQVTSPRLFVGDDWLR